MVWFRLVIMCLLVIAYSCSNNTESLGIGVFHFAPNEEEALTIYTDTELLNSDFTVSAKFNTSKPRLFLKSFNSQKVDFLPLRYGQLLGFVTFRVLQEDNGRLKVVTNEETGAFGWIAGKHEEVETWDEFLSSIHHINSQDGRIFKSPSIRSEFGHISDYDCLNVIDIQEDWIKVSHDVSKCNDPSVNSSGPSGFIRWKNEGKVLIDFRM